MATETTMTRRRFLAVSGCALAAALCSGCLRDSTQDAATAESNAAQASTNTAVPAASATRITTRCRRNQVNDPYPGRCHDYTDSNGNGICDYSET